MSKKKLEFKKPGDPGYGKNIQQVKDMVDGTFGGFKIQVGVGDQESTPNRKIGDKWFDSDGIEWEQKDGYYSKVSNLNRGIADKCQDCEKFLFDGRDKDTYVRFQRCFYCQIDFEAKLMNYPIKHWAWVRLQALMRWEIMDNDIEKIIFENHESRKNLFDKSVANAMANSNIDVQINKNKA